MTAELPKQISWKLERYNTGAVDLLVYIWEVCGTFPGDCTTLHSKSEQTLIKEEKKNHHPPLLLPSPKPFMNVITCDNNAAVCRHLSGKLLCRTSSCREAGCYQSCSVPGEPVHRDIVSAGRLTPGHWHNHK